MTVRNAVETIQRNFPAIKQKEILSRLDTAQKLFVRNTRCLLQWIDETGLTLSLIHIYFKCDVRARSEYPAHQRWRRQSAHLGLPHQPWDTDLHGWESASRADRRKVT